jgi:hypothetical protein
MWTSRYQNSEETRTYLILVVTHGIQRMTKLSLHGPDKNMLVASNGFCVCRVAVMAICQLHYYFVSYKYHCTCS